MLRSIRVGRRWWEMLIGVGVVSKADVNPMHLARRCRATSKRTGLSCAAPAVRGWSVCRMHGARGGAPSGSRNGNYRHGTRSRLAMAEWDRVQALVRLANATLADKMGRLRQTRGLVDQN